MFDVWSFYSGFVCGGVFVGFLLIVLGRKVGFKVEAVILKTYVFLAFLALIYAVLPFLEGVLFFIAVTILSIGVVLTSLYLKQKIDKILQNRGEKVV